MPRPYRRYSRRRKRKKQTAVLALRKRLFEKVNAQELQRLDARATLVRFIASALMSFVSVLAAFNLIGTFHFPVILFELFLLLLVINIPYLLSQAAGSIESRLACFCFMYYLLIVVLYFGILIVFILLLYQFAYIMVWIFPLMNFATLGFFFYFMRDIEISIWEDLSGDDDLLYAQAASYLKLEAMTGALAFIFTFIGVGLILLLGFDIYVLFGSITVSVVFTISYVILRRRREDTAGKMLSNIG